MTSYRLAEFSPATPSTEAATLDLIRDVELDLKIELGRTHMYLEDVLKLRKGSVVPLDKMAGDPVDIYVNGRLIARGEVLVLNDNFCVRVAELIVASERLGLQGRRPMTRQGFRTEATGCRPSSECSDLPHRGGGRCATRATSHRAPEHSIRPPPLRRRRAQGVEYGVASARIP